MEVSLSKLEDFDQYLPLKQHEKHSKLKILKNNFLIKFSPQNISFFKFYK